ncbi:MAG TPA: ATP synthase F1 subunit epsilon [Solirubrobacteraceae bacterium]|jgi:F-type H+-transporting ATPase subunit epsilon|nr:ATP synthase F1 subunit epsilon [Solirubrobacteraceae bacterium]
MAHTKFQVEILTPEGEVFNDEVEMVSTRTTVGSIGVLANHAPLLGMLEPTELRVYKSDDEILRFAQSEGYIQIGGNHAMLLVQDIQTPEQLDAGVLRERLSEAERELEAAGDDTERRRVALRDQKRWQVFLKVAEG